jgi:3-oxoacyl-ACP reductase-like protein
VLFALLGALATFAPSSSAFAQEADKDKPAPTPAPAAAPAAAPAPAAAAPAAPMVDSIKILFDDKAKNDGELVFTFTPDGGAAKSIRVTIAKKMDRKDVARDVAKELGVALGAGYDVDKYDPDKIKVQGKKGAKFSLTISSLTAAGLSVRLK